MLSPSLTFLFLSHIPSLVELPCSLQNLNQLKDLRIRDCINLETLPTGINLQSLDRLVLDGCPRLKSFPDISTNISSLDLSETGIEEVPWWIQKKLCRLIFLYMVGCKSLRRVSLNISELIHADFSDCEELTEVSWNDTPSELALATDNTHHSKLPDKDSSCLPDDFIPKAGLIFINCFKLDQEALLQRQSVIFPSMILPGEQVPSYFTHRTTTGTSLINIPSLHTSPSQPFLICRVCASCEAKYHFPSITVRCRFIDRLGNHFDSSHEIDFTWPNNWTSHLLIFNCRFNLPQLNSNQVDVQFQIASTDSKLKIREWGVRVLSESDDCTPFSNIQTGNPNSVACVCEADESNGDSETEHGQACSDNGVETEKQEAYQIKLALVMLLFSSFIIFFVMQNA